MTPVPRDFAAFTAAPEMHLVARQSVAYQEDHLNEDYTKNLGGYIIVLVFLSVVSMVLRLWSRFRSKEALGRDDWTYFAGSTIAIGSFIVMLIYTFDAGLGKHWVALTPAQKALFPKLNFAYNLLNVISYPLVKISLLLLFLRVFSDLKTFCRVMWGAVVFVSAVLVANTFISIFSCTPVRGFYDPSVPATCIDSVAFYYWTAVVNCVQDLFLLAVTPWAISHKRDIRYKKSILVLFVLGGLTFVLSILRIVYYTKYSADDPSFSFLDSGYATPGEVCLAIIVASAPTWTPIWHFFANLSSRKQDFDATRLNSEASSRRPSIFPALSAHDKEDPENAIGRSALNSKQGKETSEGGHS